MCPSLTAIGLHLAVGHTRNKKSPEDFSVLRGERVTSSLAASAPFLPATFVAITPFLPAPTMSIVAIVITTLIAIVVMAFVAGRDIYDRSAARHGLIHNHRRAWHHGWRARRGVNHNRARSGEDWHRQPKNKFEGNSCLGGAGQSDCGYHCYPTEQMFCFHGGSDGAVRPIFESRPLIKPEDH